MKLQRLLTIALLATLGLEAQAQAPKVETDMRYARGATMAFARGTFNYNGGTTIQKRGFCLSEQPTPTIDDIVTTKTMSAGSGTVYYFSNLKPATMYYMRAFATNKAGLTSYGDIIKFSTLPMGNITYWYNNGGDEAANKRINDAFKQACDIFSNLTSISKHFNTGYSGGTPTADCNYQDEPWMNIGPQVNYQRTGTIMHEMEHGLGVIDYNTEWSGSILRSGSGTGDWLGDRVSAFLDFWDNTTGSHLHGDKIHMWPYGVNGAQEDNGTLALYYANAMIAQALGEDGLQHRSDTYADPCYVFLQEDNIKYYLTCESKNRGLKTAYLKPTADGTLQWVTMTADEAVANDSTAWTITFTPSNQYYQLQNVATGEYLSYGSGIRTTAKKTPMDNEDWHLMKGRVDVDEDGTRGYWIIHPERTRTPRCMQANTNGKIGAASFDLKNSAAAQRWIILAASEMDTTVPTAIETVKQQSAATQQPVLYDLQGRRISQPTRGLYIQNGRKVLVK